MHRAVFGAFWGANLIRPISNSGPFCIVIYNTWCYLPSKHVVKWTFWCIFCKRLQNGVTLWRWTLPEHWFHHVSGSFCITGAKLCAFWAVVRIQSRPCTILSDTYLQEQTEVLEVRWKLCKRLQNGASSWAARTLPESPLDAVLQMSLPDGSPRGSQINAEMIPDEPGWSQAIPLEPR